MQILDEPNMMDQNAFLAINLREVAKGKVEDFAVDGLRGLQKITFNPDNIGAEAKRKLVFRNFVQQLTLISEAPSEAFVRMLLQNAGLRHIRANGLAEYQDMARDAFREFINIRILQRLDLPTKEAESKPTPTPEPSSPDVTPIPDEKIITTATELEVFKYVKERLAYLVKDEALFREIKHIEFKDHQTKFVVFYKRERKGRLFEFYESASIKYRFVFADGPEIAGNELSPIDDPLLAIFKKRVSEEGASGSPSQT